MTRQKNGNHTVRRRLHELARRTCQATGAVILLALALLIVLNLAMHPYARFAGHRSEKKGNIRTTGQDLALLEAVYPDKSTEEIIAIQRDTRNSRPTGPLVKTPPPFTSRHVNLSSQGYRHIADQKPFSSNDTIQTVFVFGGSSTWGYGLPDEETIPSHLQRYLNEGLGAPVYRVFNYGVCASYSKYEQRLLERLIRQGRVPDHVIFIDGLNDFCRIPLNRPREDGPEGPMWPQAFFDWVIRPGLFWRDALLGGTQKTKDQVVAYTPSDLARARNELADNWRMIKGICDGYDIGCTLVLQPISVYRYPLENHLFLSEENLQDEMSYYLAAREGYRLLLEQGPRIHVPFLDLHDLRCTGYEYLDTCHYTSAFASEIARRLSSHIRSTSSEANPT